MFEFIVSLMAVILFVTTVMVWSNATVFGGVRKGVSELANMGRDLDGPFSWGAYSEEPNHFWSAYMASMVFGLGVCVCPFIYFITWGLSMVGLALVVLNLTVIVVAGMSFLYHSTMHIVEVVSGLINRMAAYIRK